MASYDIMCFLEYYADRDSIIDPVSNLRVPQGQWQNFYQAAANALNTEDLKKITDRDAARTEA